MRNRTIGLSLALALALLAGAYLLVSRSSDRDAPRTARPPVQDAALTERNRTEALEVSAYSPVEMPRAARIDAPVAPSEGAPVTTYQPQPSPAAAEERDRNVKELATSGAGGAEWLDYFGEVENRWLEIDTREGFGIELDEWACFKSGCTVTIRVASLELLEQFSALARESKSMEGWRGTDLRSEPIQSDSGEIEATWIFYAPGS